jgi:hypothetical protein
MLTGQLKFIHNCVPGYILAFVYRIENRLSFLWWGGGGADTAVPPLLRMRYPVCVSHTRLYVITFVLYEGSEGIS